MKKEISLSEEQLRNTIKQTIAEALMENQPMFYVEDEASGEIYYNTSDIEDAKEWVTNNPSGCYVVTDNNGDEVWRNKPGVSYKFESINMQHIENAIRKVMKENLNENFFDHLYNAHVPSNKEIPNPTVKDVIERNGWVIKNSKESNGGTLFQIEQKTGAFGNTDGTLNLDELMGDIKTFGKAGRIMKRESLYGDRMCGAEKAIIYIQN